MARGVLLIVALSLSTGAMQDSASPFKRPSKYFPHVMFYAPYATNEDIGSDGKDPFAPWVLNPGTPHAYVIVVSAHPR